MTDVERVRQMARFDREFAADSARRAKEQPGTVEGQSKAASWQSRADHLNDEAALMDRAADALAREPALMRVAEAARAVCGYAGPKTLGALEAALRALDEVGR